MSILKAKSTLIQNKVGWLGFLLTLLLLASCAPAEPAVDETPINTVAPTSMPTRTASPTQAFTPTPTEQPSLGIDAEDLTGIVLRFAHPWIGETAETLENLAMEFSLSNPWDIWVEVYSYGGETALIEALQDQLDQGEMPGLVAAPPYLLTALTGDYVSADLSRYFYDAEWGLTPEEREDIPPVFLEPFTLDDRIIAMPFAPQATVLFYNTTWGKELGFSEPPSSLSTFRTQSCDATFNNWQDDTKQGGTGGWVINLDPAVLASWYSAFEGSLPNADVPSFNNPSGQDAFGYLWDIKSQGCIWFALQPDPYFYFADRLALLFAGRLDQVPVLMNWMEAVGGEDEWELIGFPGPAGEVILVDSPGLMISADTPEQELAAWLFTQYLLEPKSQAKLVQAQFSLPVRSSTMALLTDFAEDYPQWAQGAALLPTARSLPASEGWGVGQWVFQDAVNRILQAETPDIPGILAQLDAMIVDILGTSR
jgi:multiple sugar transport system substrate-binding protein